ncbi:MAG: transposase [Bdellovibrionota bacterium]
MNNRELFPLPLPEVWKIACEHLYLSTHLHGIEIHAFVLMPNHLHLLLTTPEADLGTAMNWFNGALTRSINGLSGRSGHLFGGPYYRSIIRSSAYFTHAHKYVYRNPVKAKLCTLVEEYPWSTLSGLVGNGVLPFPLFHSRSGLGLSLIPANMDDYLAWLNRPFPNEAELLIRRGLRTNEFSKILDRATRRPYPQLEGLL